MSRAVKLAPLELEMVLRAMEFIEAGEWPWAEGCTEQTAARERAAWMRAKSKLEGSVR